MIFAAKYNKNEIMEEGKIFLWFWTMFPLVFSAGPANITLAAFGVRFGLLKSLSFIAGVNIIVLLQTVLVGFGLNRFLGNYPEFFNLLQIAGAAYLVYMAFKFFKSKQISSTYIDEIPTFRDGVVLQLLNMKGLVMITVMFSQFLDKDIMQLLQVSILSIGLLALTTVAMILWTIGGEWLIGRFSSQANERLLGYVFGSMLLGVAVWMLF